MWKSLVAVVVSTVTGGAQRITTVHALVTATTYQAGGHAMKMTPETLCNKCGRCCYFKARNLEGDPCLPTDCPLAQVYGPPGYVGPKEKA